MSADVATSLQTKTSLISQQTPFLNVHASNYPGSLKLHKNGQEVAKALLQHLPETPDGRYSPSVAHKITATESTDIMYTSRNLAIVPCSLSLAGNTTRTGRIVGIIATSVVENQEFIARDTFKIRSTCIVVPVRSFRHEFVARLATSHAIGPSIRRRSQRHNACVDTHSSLVLSHNGLLKVDKQVLPSFRTYQK